MRKKLFISLLYAGLSFVFVIGISHGQGFDSYKTEPKDILNYVVDNVNDGNNSKIIRSELDQVSKDQGVYGDQFAIANTLESLRRKIAIYLQWLSFLAMVLATVLIIYNGLRFVLSPLQPEEASNIKKRLMYIILGLLVSTGFYYIIKITLSVSIQATY